MNLPNSQQTPLDKFLRVFLRAIGKKKKRKPTNLGGGMSMQNWICFYHTLLWRAMLVAKQPAMSWCRAKKKVLGRKSSQCVTGQVPCSQQFGQQWARWCVAKSWNFTEVLPCVPLELQFHPCFWIPEVCSPVEDRSCIREDGCTPGGLPVRTRSWSQTGINGKSPNWGLQPTAYELTSSAFALLC